MLADKIRQTITERLKEKDKNIRNAERLSGLPRNTIRNILSGTSLNPTIETLNSIAKYLDCTIDELIGNQPIMSKSHQKLEWNKILFFEILEYLLKNIEDNKYMVTFDQVFFLVEEVYKYSMLMKNKQFDKEFTDWIIAHNLTK